MLREMEGMRQRTDTVVCLETVVYYKNWIWVLIRKTGLFHLSEDQGSDLPDDVYTLLLFIMKKGSVDM